MPAGPTRPDADGFLPLRPVEFQILVSLSRRDLHGYGILKDAEERGEAGAVPGLATLYRALKRLQKEGLIAETDAPEETERRRYFRLTTSGRRVAAAEARRLRSLLDVARRGELLEGERGAS